LLRVNGADLQMPPEMQKIPGMRHSAQKKAGFSTTSAETVAERAGTKMAGCGMLHQL
jgi:hypothetical protein